MIFSLLTSTVVNVPVSREKRSWAALGLRVSVKEALNSQLHQTVATDSKQEWGVGGGMMTHFQQQTCTWHAHRGAKHT